MAPLVETENLVKTYRMGGSELRVIDGLSLTIMPGEYVAVMGPSGCGKSTLLHILGLLDRPDSGKYRLGGSDVSSAPERGLCEKRSSSIGFVFQFFNLLPRTTALRNVELPMVYRGLPGRLRRALASQALTEVGLSERQDHAPHQLSGGEQQRVAIARAVAGGPSLLLADEPTGNLNTEQAGQILDIIGRMNGRGITVVLVTHDPEVAQRAGRLVTMRDGRIVSDKPRSQGAEGPAERPPAVSAAPYPRDLWSPLAKLHENMRMALAALSANMIRTNLAALGIVIGVAAVVTMVGIGSGARAQARERIAALGANLLILIPEGGPSEESARQLRLDLDDAQAVSAMKSADSGIARVNPVVSRPGVTVIRGPYNAALTVMGVSELYPEVHEARPDWGRFFTREEDLRLAKVCVLGPGAARKLFDPRSDPLGETVKINGVYFTVIGILPPKGASGMTDLDERVLVPVSTAMKRLFGAQKLNFLEIQMASPDKEPLIQKEVKELLRSRHRIPAFKADGFTIKSLTSVQETLSGVARTLSLLLGAIAAVSLLVGGIGIMNIMLVSVRERTREVGLRKSMGASDRDILAQFLTEAALIALSGGLMGILLGFASCGAVARLAGWKLIVNSASVLSAFAFSAATGVVFGLWPALEAARQPPAVALRYE